MKKVIVIGAGNRGMTYSQALASYKDAVEFVAVAEPIDDRRNFMRDTYAIPEQMCFKSWEEILSRPKFADVVIIATMDRDHIAPALAAIEKGYDILLEKPMGATPEECCTLERAAKEKGVFVLVCHVLRFTKFWRLLKALVDSGKVGDIVHIQHAECVGNLHQSHSFVRGNWRNSEESSCMILQKCCHDMDILAFLIGKRCKRVHSFGGLMYFKEENAPEGAPERCIDGCPHSETCYYYAPRLYMEKWRNNLFTQMATQRTSPTDEDVLDAMKNGEYGRCVFRCPNNVVDHQTVNLEFEGGATVSFTMCAFNRGSRNIRIMGTKGELTANMGGDHVMFYNFATNAYEKIMIDDALRDDTIFGGHGGGDGGIIGALLKKLEGEEIHSSICTIEETARNHLIAFAAEKSRLCGEVVDMDEYERSLGGLI